MMYTTIINGKEVQLSKWKRRQRRWQRHKYDNGDDDVYDDKQRERGAAENDNDNDDEEDNADGDLGGDEQESRIGGCVTQIIRKRRQTHVSLRQVTMYDESQE